MNHSLNSLFREWHDIKQNICALETQSDEIRNAIHLIMNDNYTNRLDTNEFKCTRSVYTRQTLHKQDVPPEIFNRYAREKPVVSVRLHKKCQPQRNE